nr:DUF3426 domain-containing protein [uncultured Psychrobacter sp.]
MTTPINTQCPYCGAHFHLHQNQLNKEDAKIVCNQCSRSFRVSDNLSVATFDSHSLSDSIPLNSQTIDSLIQDEAQGSHATTSEYDSLDYMLENMEPWSKPVSSSDASSLLETSSEPELFDDSVADSDNNTAHTLLNDEGTLTDFDTDTDTQVALKKSTVNSSATNNTGLENDHTFDNHSLDKSDGADNAWLEQLLAEESEDDIQHQNDTDLSQLLIDMGVPFEEEGDANDGFELANKPLERHQTMQTSSRTSMAILLWTAGSLALVLLLLAQYVIFNVDTLVKDPIYAQRLQKICTVAACSLPNADLSQLTIADITHRSSQLNDSGTYSDIRATLNNQSSQSQLLPSLRVSLYGSDKLIGAFIAAPDDYLLSPQNQLAVQGQKQLWFTVPIDNQQISTVTIEPIY